MSGDFALLRRFDPAGLRDAAEGWRRLSAAAEDAGGQHRRRVNGPLRGHWQGKDADSAFFTMESTEQKLEVVRVEAESAALVLDTVADRMDQARTNLSNALQRADEWNLPVADDGTVGLPPQAAPDRHDPDAREERQSQHLLRDQLQDRINASLAAAREASDQGARALGRLGADILAQPRVFGAAAESAQDVQDVAKDLGLAAPYIPENKDPRQSAEWWKSLTPEQQQSCIALHPEEIGRLDGLPATVRDQANRLVVEQQLDTLKAGNAKGSGITYEEWNQRQTNLHALKEALDKGDAADEQHQLFLLQVDASGDGKAVVSTGNPDTADHTAVLVPGTGTTMTSTSGQIDRIGRLQDSAERADPGSKVAVISWLGYDAPEVSGSVLTPGRAEDGAEDMRRFTDGVRTAQGDHRSNLTVIGHSYGTTAVGAAAAGGQGLQADDIVAIASPGMDTDNAANLHINPDHFWAGTADDDNISLVTGATLGPDPTLGAFGGQTLGIDTHGHSGYWDPDSESLNNQGRIIAGRRPNTVDNHRDEPSAIVPGL
ncbi:alpha/beta hydrolase [Kitasatospora sp. YST-16]|uniref:alpha/beta hydrolase n=1 Tax=Kitasatospora sp. YST-16 TaxID=2998080 RepID=UPI0022834FEE|nr:alpha/beta hydrolase [Kitasatospora sp. YST-16]WAL75379.1 alpha/beta hydrolase [Kitasatospora sp. YST-16]WNW41439.1 alpha/beta hydrolase [Streptomyces sp. Li-HN-5-13]